MSTILTIVGILVCIAALYIAAGTFACWALSSAGDEKMSLNGVTIKFILTWPQFLFKAKML